MLLAGEIDAAIIPGKIEDPRLRPLIPDHAKAAAAWAARHGAMQVNHLIAVKGSLSREHPAVIEEIYRLAKAAKAKIPAASEGRDPLPFGFTAVRPSLTVALDYAFQQRLIPRRFAVEELFDDLTRTLE